MLIHIDTHRGVPYFRQVKEQVIRMILSGQLAAGEKLESVAKLAKRLKVNPMTISKAYSFMVEEKILERRAGIGVFVAALPDHKQQEMTSALLTTTLSKAATLSMQLGMAQSEAERLFADEFLKIKDQEANND